MMKIILIGANNPEAGRMIHAIQKSNNFIKFSGFIDNDPLKKGKKFLGLPVFGGYDCVTKIIDKDTYFVNLITRDCRTRYETSLQVAKKGGKFTNFIHPTVCLDMVKLGFGNYIQESVFLQANVEIGNNSSISAGALICHETRINNSVFVAPGVTVCGIVSIEDGVFVGAGATILPRLKIGKFSTVGAGAVVIHDVPDYSVVVGNPAKIIKHNQIKYVEADIPIFTKNDK